ncbi:18801_t:CDS:1 [Racocetra fulgida]|uniref:18801_t:CDS:1 n=1 Tax=Racocetra fulgida TaxID=60492 RepID=A0A9N9IFN8_9GLOM|nr:18801_t:CDS:1 [Racocetra fulgida]
MSGQYPIPNKYQIEAFWGRNKKNHVQTSIDYVEGIPHFKIEWIYNEQNCIVVSQISPSDVSNQYCNIRYSERKTAISGILVFGLQLYEKLTKAMPKKNQPQCIKPLSDLSNSSYRNKIKKAGESLFNDFEKKKKIWHSIDNSKLKELVLEAGEQPWLIKFEEDQQLEEKKAQKIVQIINESNISRRGYRALTTTSTDLLKEWLVSKEKNNVNETMQNHIPLLLFDMNANSDSDSASDSDSEHDSDSESDSNGGSDLDSEVIATTLEKGAYRNITAIL